jgi:hypothetical protein
VAAIVAAIAAAILATLHAKGLYMRGMLPKLFSPQQSVTMKHYETLSNSNDEHYETLSNCNDEHYETLEEH